MKQIKYLIYIDYGCGTCFMESTQPEKDIKYIVEEMKKEGCEDHILNINVCIKPEFLTLPKVKGFHYSGCCAFGA